MFLARNVTGFTLSKVIDSNERPPYIRTVRLGQPLVHHDSTAEVSGDDREIPANRKLTTVLGE